MSTKEKIYKICFPCILLVITFNCFNVKNLYFHQLPKLSSFNDKDQAEQHLSMQKESRKKILLYTYMRGGSSLLGEIFHQNRNAMYWFEALDGFYQTYFVSRANTHPLQLLYYRNQTKRALQPDESAAVATFHRDLFTCNYRDLPMSLFADFQNHRSSINFRHCGMAPRTVVQCQNILQNICLSPDFESSNDKKFLKSVNMETSIKNKCFGYINTILNKNNTINQIDPLFLNYRQCLQRMVSHFVEKCESDAVLRCKESKILVAKEIRLSMELVEDTLITLPDMYFIYYVRDPRAVVASRNGQLSSFEWYNLESKIFCERLKLDLSIFRDLKKKYPKRILELKYEDLALNPIEYSKSTYDFIGESLPMDVAQWIQDATTGKSKQLSYAFSTTRANSSAEINAWREKLQSHEILGITDNCRDVLDMLNYTI